MQSSCYIQIGDDPTKWWVAELVQANQLTGQPLTVVSLAPIEGTLVLSPTSASVGIFNVSPTTLPAPLGLPGRAGIIYVPTLTGPSAGHVGYQLAGNVDPQSLADQIAEAMIGERNLSVDLAGGGTLVLNGATLSFAITAPAAIGGATPRG